MSLKYFDFTILFQIQNISHFNCRCLCRCVMQWHNRTVNIHQMPMGVSTNPTRPVPCHKYWVPHLKIFIIHLLWTIMTVYSVFCKPHWAFVRYMKWQFLCPINLLLFNIIHIVYFFITHERVPQNRFFYKYLLLTIICHGMHFCHSASQSFVSDHTIVPHKYLQEAK